MPNFRAISPYLLSLVFAVVISLFHIPEHLGAHPWWAIKVIWIGLPIGAVVAYLAAWGGLGKSLRLVLFVVVVIGAFYAATQGKSVFVNSYAENGLAGRFWYFGWIGTMAALSGLIITVARK